MPTKSEIVDFLARGQRLASRVPIRLADAEPGQDRRLGRFRGLRRQGAAGPGNNRSYSFLTTA